MINKIPPPACIHLPLAQTLLWQPRRTIRPLNHGESLHHALPILYLQQWPGEPCRRHRRPIHPCKPPSTTKLNLFGAHQLSSVQHKDGFRAPLLRTIILHHHWPIRLVLVLAHMVVRIYSLLSTFGKRTDRSRLLTPLGSSSLSVSTSGPAGGWTQLNPLLDSRSPHCLHFDLGLPIQYIHNMNESAVQPPVAFMQVLIVLNPFKWPVNIQVHGPVSVYQVVQQLHEFLQGYQHSQDMQKSKIVSSSLSSFAYHGHPQPQSDNYRDQNQRPSEFYSGTKRIDLLGRYRIFRGLSLSSSEHGTSWVVHLSDRWLRLLLFLTLPPIPAEGPFDPFSPPLYIFQNAHYSIRCTTKSLPSRLSRCDPWYCISRYVLLLLYRRPRSALCY